jgi:hypothetical protein
VDCPRLAGYSQTWYLTKPETDSAGEIVEVGAVAVPDRVGVLLNVQPKSKAFVRRRLITREGEPTELVSLWLPLELSEGTDLTSGEPLRQGFLEHLQARKGVRFDHIVEQITARMPTAHGPRPTAHGPRDQAARHAEEPATSGRLRRGTRCLWPAFGGHGGSAAC